MRITESQERLFIGWQTRFTSSLFRCNFYEVLPHHINMHNTNIGVVFNIMSQEYVQNR